MRLIDADKLLDSLRGNVLVDVTSALEDVILVQPTVANKRKRVLLNRFRDPRLSELDYAEVGGYVYATGWAEEFGLTKNKLYEILDTDGFSSVQVITDDGQKTWFSVEYFSNTGSL